jgi:hypothetical protein
MLCLILKSENPDPGVSTDYWVTFTNSVLGFTFDAIRVREWETKPTKGLAPVMPSLDTI